MASKRVNQGRNKIRDLLKTDIAEMAVGTDDTNPSQTDSSLGAEVFRDSITNEEDGTGRVAYVLRLGTGDANGETLQEAGVIDSDGDLNTRHTFADTPKQAGQEVEFRIIEQIQNP